MPVGALSPFWFPLTFWGFNCFSMSSDDGTVLRRSDGQLFDEDESVARQEAMVNFLLDDFSSVRDPVPLHNVSGSVLSKAIEFLHDDARILGDNSPSREINLERWGKEFLKVDQNILFDLILDVDFFSDTRGLKQGCLMLMAVADLGPKAAHDMDISSLVKIWLAKLSLI